MNEYKAMKERHQQEVYAFPLGYAFGNQQFKELMEKWGLDADKKEDLAQVSSLFGGAYILKKDIPAYRDMCRRHREEREAAIAADQTGDGYISSVSWKTTNMVIQGTPKTRSSYSVIRPRMFWEIRGSSTVLKRP